MIWKPVWIRTNRRLEVRKLCLQFVVASGVTMTKHSFCLLDETLHTSFIRKSKLIRPLGWLPIYVSVRVYPAGVTISSLNKCSYTDLFFRFRLYVCVCVYIPLRLGLGMNWSWLRLYTWDNVLIRLTTKNGSQGEVQIRMATQTCACVSLPFMAIFIDCYSC